MAYWLSPGMPLVPPKSRSRRRRDHYPPNRSSETTTEHIWSSVRWHPAESRERAHQRFDQHRHRLLLVERLRITYEEPGARAARKVIDHPDRDCRTFIAMSPSA